MTTAANIHEPFVTDYVAVLDWIDPSWRSRFDGPEQAYDSYKDSDEMKNALERFNETIC